MTTTHKAKERDAKERDRGHAAIVSFFTLSGTQTKISTTTATTAFVDVGSVGGIASDFMWVPSGWGAGRFATAGAVTTSLREKEECDPELAEQILQLAKEPPAAVFDSPDKLMDWLDDIEK
jgi:hypothetical protein